MTTADRATIAELADELGHGNGKRIRAYLRSNASRTAEVKGSRWGDAKTGYALSAKLTATVRERFAATETAETA